MGQALASKQRFFSEQELSQLNWDNTPKNIAIIPDGNRRWARTHEVPIAEGHAKGCSTLIEIVKSACELNIKSVTAYLFSTENWGRPTEEIDALMWLFHIFLIQNCETMIDYGIRLHTIGILDRIPEYVRETIQQTKDATAHCTTIDLILAVNYGGRDEITRTMQSLAEEVKAGTLSPNSINEALIASRLDTAPWSDPDLLIRAGGEMRISNYLLWQLSYTELYFSKTLWPAFTPAHLLAAVSHFQTCQRRLGKQ